MPTSFPGLTPARAAAHEALFLKLSALLVQAEKTATRYPDRAVPAATLAVAEAMLAGAAAFAAGRSRRRERLPMAAPVWGGLYSQLAQALAALDHFEAQHTKWDDQAKARMWQLPGEPAPVRRLRPMVVPTQADYRRNVQLERQKLARRFAEIGVTMPHWPARLARKRRRLSPPQTPDI